MNGLGNIFIHDKVQLTLFRGTHRQAIHFPVIIAPICLDIPYHLTYLHGLDLSSLGNIPHPMRTSTIGHPNVPSKPGL